MKDENKMQTTKILLIFEMLPKATKLFAINADNKQLGLLKSCNGKIFDVEFLADLDVIEKEAYDYLCEVVRNESELDKSQFVELERFDLCIITGDRWDQRK